MPRPRASKKEGWLGVVLTVLAGCGSRTELVAPEGEASADVAVEAAPMTCSVTLSVGAVDVTAGCWIDEKVSHQSAALRWACDAGAAEADFAVPFNGSVAEPSTQVTLTATTTFPWGDGCTWQSEQRIEGALSAGTLQYSYSEKPIQGTSCAPAYCTGSASVSVQ